VMKCRPQRDMAKTVLRLCLRGGANEVNSTTCPVQLIQH
jgi:hypothetical protein